MKTRTGATKRAILATMAKRNPAIHKPASATTLGILHRRLIFRHKSHDGCATTMDWSEPASITHISAGKTDIFCVHNPRGIQFVRYLRICNNF